MLFDWLYDVNLWLKSRLWRPLGHFSATFHPLPFVAGGLVAYLFAVSGQMHQVYISVIETRDWLHAGFGLAAVFLLSAALYHVYFALSTTRIDVIYDATGSPRADLWLRGSRNVFALACAALPWAGVAMGLIVTARMLGKNGRNLEAAVSPYGPDAMNRYAPDIPLIDDLSRHADMAALAVLAVAAAALAALHAHRHGRRVKAGILAGVLAVLAAVMLIRFAAPEGAVDFYRAAGPLAVISASALSIFAVVAVLALLSRSVGFPLVTLTLAAVAAVIVTGFPPVAYAALAGVGLFLVLAAVALASRRFALAGLSAAFATLSGVAAGSFFETNPEIYASRGAGANATLTDRFETWLAARGRGDRPAFEGKPYPVFIIAAQGGGIYAAASAAAFLSRLQDRCPNFAQHVFAISGVSGGAIGAAVFQSLVQNETQSAELCGASVKNDGRFFSRTSEIFLDDHLSPVASAIVPDLLGPRLGRAEALEETILASARGVNGLSNSFASHWKPEGPAPALILNATWVEKGYRVAFAPFALKNEEDHTLLAFSDLVESSRDRPSLIQAAGVSARFPFILPAFPVEFSAGRRWNLVDGGYADASGAATALAIYERLDKLKRPDVDLRLVLLTDAVPKDDHSKLSGTEALDTAAPIETILRVRALNARQAVARTKTEVPKEKRGVVELDHQSFALPLGWKISKTTHDIVALFAGQPELCKRAPAEETISDDEGLSHRILAKNSCVMKTIEARLSGLDADF